MTEESGCALSWWWLKLTGCTREEGEVPGCSRAVWLLGPKAEKARTHPRGCALHTGQAGAEHVAFGAAHGPWEAVSFLRPHRWKRG